MADLTTKEIYRNSTPTFTFTMKDSDDNIFDLTGYTGNFIAKSRDGITTIFDNALTITTPTTGIATCLLSASDTATAGEYRAEVEIKSTTPIREFTVIQFYLRIIEDIRT